MPPTLHLYNTASRSKDAFTTPDKTVGMYCCGPTVYNFAHIGNLRTYLFEDVLRRTLIALGYELSHVVNITDVGHLTSDADDGDDKMEKGALREGKSVWEIAAAYTAKFMENIKDLNIQQPERWCKATDHIQEMIDYVKKLQEKGFTYQTSDGIYFDTTKFPAYVDFARLDIESLKAGSRVDMGEKRAVTDFALWKFSPKDSKRQMEWESPWGTGFPGWHIECSAMSLKYLSQPLDIHCGGTDHIRVHHTNEIAQVEAATGKPFARFWLHGEFLVMDSGKMSKSTGSFITVDKLKELGIKPLAYRLFCFSAHYRSPLTFSIDGVTSSQVSLKNLKKLIADSCSEGTTNTQRVEAALVPFFDALCDDLNIPKALAAVYELLRDATFTSVEKYAAIKTADTILGLDLLVAESDAFVKELQQDGMVVRVIAPAVLADEIVSEIAKLAFSRKIARKEKRFADADVIRDEFIKRNIDCKDLKDDSTECVVK